MTPTTSTKPERREHRRAKIDLLVNRFLNGHPYMCRMTDISRTGARLVPIIEPHVSPPPAFIGLQFQLPGHDGVVTASGQMVPGGPGRAVGVRFTNLPGDSAGVIGAFLDAFFDTFLRTQAASA
jgi:hypothetical protein